ncbi:MAG TPA: sporulation initiation factor Spo0A C-terminal domain-containing protein [Bacilli bacterium]|nr:sporulation initiation factor Spo0A C-terminal domain-containing protein [Bacilli bacterium]
MKILFIDDNKEFVDLAVKYLMHNKNIKHIDCVYDGKEVLNIIKNNKYDLIILDLVLPKYDGIYLLNSLNNKSKIIVSTSYNCNNMLLSLNKYNISSILIKPYTLDYLEKKILEIYNDNNTYNIYDVLHKFGISRNLKGYKYIEESVSYINEDSSIFIKDIYKKLSETNNTNYFNIERAIRNAIEVGSKKGDTLYYEKIFGYTVDYNKAKPTNKQFLFTLYEYLNSNNSNK